MVEGLLSTGDECIAAFQKCDKGTKLGADGASRSLATANRTEQQPFATRSTP